MKRLAIALLATLGGAPLAQAADLASTKSEPEKAETNCYASIQDWWNTSSAKCPLTYAGITLYGTIDGGYGYNTAGSNFGGFYDKGVFYGIRKTSSAQGAWLWSPNAQGTSNIGVKMKEKIVDDWFLIGAAESAFNPYSLNWANGPKSLATNNLTKAAFSTADGDSSRAGQWANSQAFVGISNKTYGTVTVGRVNALSLDLVSAYDPVRSNAFSMLGFAGSFGGLGVSELTRVNTGVVYRVDVSNFRFAALSQFGNGYYFGNSSMGEYQAQVGATFGDFSIDAVGSYARDAVALASYNNVGLPAGYDPFSVLKATLSDATGLAVAARYKWKPFEFYAGYTYARLTNPSDAFPQGFQTIAEGIIVPAGAVNATNYTIPRILNTYWTGVKWDTPVKDLTVSTGLYYHTSNDYNPATCTGTGIFTSSGKCAGSQFNYSMLINYKLFARVDLYGGVMVSNVYGGHASGYATSQNIDPTVGLRFRF